MIFLAPDLGNLSIKELAEEIARLESEDMDPEDRAILLENARNMRADKLIFEPKPRKTP